MEEKEIMLLIGPNMSGKTRLLKAMKSAAGKAAAYVDCEFQEVKKPAKAKMLLLDEPFACVQGWKRLVSAQEIAALSQKASVIAATVKEDAESLFPEGTRLNVIRLKGEKA